MRLCQPFPQRAAWALCLAAAAAQAQPAPGADEALIARVVADLPGAIVTQHSRPHSLQAQMAAAGVPALSVAVFRDGRLAWARAWGVRDAQAGGPVDVHTLFQAASISKPVTALGALLLADAGRLALDADIGTAVPGWRAPVAVSPRQLLSHSAGLGVPGFAGYAAGAPLPSVAQVLAGAPPANSPPVRVDGPQGQARYSGGGYVLLQAWPGGGYVLLQAWLAQRSGQPFAAWMQQAVLAPLGMQHSQFAQPLPEADAARAASGHRDGQPLPGRWHSYPELAAAGLWTTPTDLGRVAAALQDSLAGRPSPLPGAAFARQMLLPQAGSFGLGWVLDRRHGEPLFGHLGLNEGFEALLAASASPTSPQHLVVVMSNGQRGTPLAQALLRAVAREVGWAAHAPRQVLAQALLPADLAALEGLYRSGAQAVAVEVHDGVAHLRDGLWQRAPLVPLSATRFAVENRTIDLQFDPPGADGRRSLVLLPAPDDGTPQRLLQVPPALAAADVPAPLWRGSLNNWGSDLPFSAAGS